MFNRGETMNKKIQKIIIWFMLIVMVAFFISMIVWGIN